MGIKILEKGKPSNNSAEQISRRHQYHPGYENNTLHDTLHYQDYVNLIKTYSFIPDPALKMMNFCISSC